jgi:hypothetical protein
MQGAIYHVRPRGRLVREVRRMRRDGSRLQEDAGVMPEEQPPPGTPCVVDVCERPATVYVDIAGGEALEGETSAAMCDEHAAHWRNAQE